MTAWGDGRVYKRGSVYWIQFQSDVNGRSTAVREGSWPTEALAHKALRSRTFAVRADRQGMARFEASKARTLTIAEIVADKLQHDVDRGIKSAATNRVHAKPLLAVMAHRRVTALNGKQIESYIVARRTQQIADATIDRELGVLSAAIHLARRNGTIAWDFPIRTVARHNANARQGFLEPVDLKRLLAAFADRDQADFVEWLGWTAMRIGETSSLRWSSISEGTLVLQAADAKIGKARVVPVWRQLKEILDRRKLRRIPGLDLIFHASGRRCTRAQGGWIKPWYDGWATAVEKAGLPASLIPYDLRRSALRNMDKAGVPRAVQMAISGLLTESTYLRYRIVDLAEMREALDRVKSAWERETKQKERK